MKKKGLSFEDKRQKMFGIFLEKQEFFHLKDIEKESIKRGITFQTVKEVLDSLVGDDMVTCDKIGSSIFYWALKSKMLSNNLNKLAKLEETLKNLKQSNNNFNNEIEIHKANCKESDERKNNLKLLAELRSEEEELDKELNEYKANDPLKYNKMEHDNTLLVNGIEMHTDNLYILDKFVRSRGTGENLKDIFLDYDFMGLLD